MVVDNPYINSAVKVPDTEVEVLGSFLSSCWVAFGRPSYLWAVLLGVPRHWRVPPASGSHPPRLLPPLGGGIAWRPKKGNANGGRRYFWPCQTHVGFLWTHLKNGLPLVRAFWPRPYQQQLPDMHSSRPTRQLMPWIQPADDSGTSCGPSTASQTNHSYFSHSNSFSKS